MPIFEIDQFKINSRMMTDILQSTPLSRQSAGSKMRALLETISPQIADLSKDFNANMIQAYLPFATGDFLDLIGVMLGLERKQESQSRIEDTDQNIQFYVSSGTFGDINGGADISIPSGTIIKSTRSTDAVQYMLSSSVILNSVNTSFYVPADAVSVGKFGNTGASTLIYHNFISYTDHINESLKVTNQVDINGGQNTELDSNYRYRLSNQVLSSEKANETSVRLAALTVPGVAEVISMPFRRGLGTYDLLIKSTSPSVSNGLLSAVQRSITKVTAEGISPLARKPIETGISLKGTVTFKTKLSVDVESTILENAQDTIIDYINNLDIGEELIINEILQRVMNVSEQIKKLGMTGEPLDYIYTHSFSALKDNKVRNEIFDDYLPRPDEKLLIETVYAGLTPVLFIGKT